MDKEADNYLKIIHNKDEIIRIDTMAFKDLSAKYIKQGKKVHRQKQMTMVFIITSSLLGILVLLK
jgi:hypothetical protein